MSAAMRSFAYATIFPFFPRFSNIPRSDDGTKYRPTYQEPIIIIIKTDIICDMYAHVHRFTIEPFSERNLFFLLSPVLIITCPI